LSAMACGLVGVTTTLRHPTLATNARWIVEQKIARSAVSVVGVSHGSGWWAGIEGLALKLLGRVMSGGQATWCQVAAVVHATLLPANRTRSAACTARVNAATFAGATAEFSEQATAVLAAGARRAG
jgi:hypothetical protein